MASSLAAAKAKGVAQIGLRKRRRHGFRVLADYCDNFRNHIQIGESCLLQGRWPRGVVACGGQKLRESLKIGLRKRRRHGFRVLAD